MADRLDSYADVTAFLNRFTDYERMTRVRTGPPLGLGRIRRLLETTGNPHLRLRSIHVAGTKGKGSTCAMAAAILRQAGHKVGLYTSPHLLSPRERIQIDGEWISEQQVVELMNVMHPYLTETRSDGELYAPTFFEIYTALAFLHFEREGVDFAVFEVGLGGRLDATNVVQPLAAAITPIGYDHMDKLGDTLDQIAFEKAGIVKPGVPVISAPQEPEAAAVIERVCARREAPLRAFGRDIHLTSSGDTFDLRTWRREHRGLTVPLPGAHQRENAATAVGIIDALSEQGIEISEDAVRDGLRSLTLSGRIEVVAERPTVIIDCAHTVESARVLTRTLAESFPRRRLVLVVSIASDKDVAGFLRTVVPCADEVVLTTMNNPRSSQPAALLETVREFSRVECICEPDTARAIGIGRDRTGPDDLLLITGSLYLAGEAKRLANESFFETKGVTP